MALLRVDLLVRKRNAALIALGAGILFLRFLTPAHAAYEISNGSVQALYHLEDTSDSSGNGYDLSTAGSFSFPSGLTNLANDADAGTNNTSSYLGVSNNLGITGGPATFSFWVKINTALSSNGQDYFFFNQEDAGSETGYTAEYYDNAGTDQLYFDRLKPGRGHCYISGDETLTAGTWYYLVLTYDGTNLQAWINDDPFGTAACSGSGTYGYSFLSLFAQAETTPSYFASDQMDEFVVLNTAISTTTMADLYDGGAGQAVCVTSGCGSGGGAPESYYAEIEGGSHHIFSTESDSSPILKTLPADWVIQVVSSTDISGDPMISGGYHWFKVMDPTDGVTGWMAASDTMTQYISSYDGSSQSTFEDMASTTQDDEASRATVIQAAVDHYYTNTSSTGSLYSSDDLSSVFSSSSPDTYPEDLIFPIAAWEDGDTSTVALNNEEVTFDYGHGIMQITPTPSSSDIYFLQKILNSNSVTQVATSGIGSPGMEGDHFGAATENAVERFQNLYGLATSGAVRFQTRAQLNSMLPTSSIPAIPSAFRFERNLQEGMTDNTSSYSEARGLESGVFIPPCGNLQDPSTSTYYQLCYGDNTSTNPKAYAPQPDYGNQVFKWYANTSQSIYSNIKDGLEILKEKYTVCHAGSTGICSPTNTTSTVDGETFTYDQKRDILATWGYNGFVTSTGVGYLTDIAGRLENINDYFSAIPDPSTATGTWYNKLIVAADNLDTFRVMSPVDVSIVDSEGRSTGVVNGTPVAQIPNSEYNPQTETGVVLFPNDTFTFSLKGTANDTYGFIVTSNDNSATTTVYQALNIPIKTGAIHTYTIDFNKLRLGQPGVTVKMDDTGDGKIDRTVTNIGTVSFVAPPKFVAPSFPVAPPKPKPIQPAPRIFQTPPTVPTSTTNFASSTLPISSSSFTATSSLENFTSTIETASSTIQINSSTESNE